MEGILNLYKDNERFYHEKGNLEFFLKTFSPDSYRYFSDRLQVEVYIQFLSVLNPLFLRKEYTLLLECAKQAYGYREIVCRLQGAISPALLFFPCYDNTICDNLLLSLLAEHTEKTIQPERRIPLVDDDFFLRVSTIAYPNRYICQYKADGADDLIGGISIELLYRRKGHEYVIARVGMYEWKDNTLISCVQNRKIGRINYSIGSCFPGVGNLFEIPLFFLSKVLCRWKSKTVWFFRDSAHNCRIYTMKNGGFKGVYDELGMVHGMEQYGNIFWKTDAGILYENYRYIEKFFPENSLQKFTDL